LAELRGIDAELARAYDLYEPERAIGQAEVEQEP